VWQQHRRLCLAPPLRAARTRTSATAAAITIAVHVCVRVVGVRPPGVRGSAPAPAAHRSFCCGRHLRVRTHAYVGVRGRFYRLSDASDGV
jgi:hypothetical protein